MKTILTRFKALLLATVLCCIGKLSVAQQTFNCYIANDHLVSPTVYEFDIYLQATGADIYFRTLQVGLQFNPGFIPSGALVTGSVVFGSTQMNSYTPAAPQWNSTFSCFSVPANTGGLCFGDPTGQGGNSTLLSTAVGTKRVATYRVTSSIPFTCNSPNINMIRPSDTSPSLQILKMALTGWSPTCVSQTISTQGTYSHFGANTLYSQVNNQGASADDGNICTADNCNPVTGAITHTPVNTDDGDACTVDGCDPVTGVYHNPVNTDDGNVCTTDGCDPSTGVFHNPVNVDDNNPCTADGCDPLQGPFHNPIDFSDANLCDIESCDPATGNISHTPVNTDDNNACTNDACDPATGNISHTAVNVDDGDACTNDACDPANGNISHTPVSVDDNNACTIDACDPSTGFISHTPVNIDDNNACTTDACDPASGNITHTPINIDDNNACTTDACDPANGSVTHTPVNTDDGDACTIDACNPSTGFISHTPVNIDDQNACTIDACDPSTGNITHTNVNIDDNNACTVDACDPATGNITHTAINIDDNNACTTDACDPATGNVTHTAVVIDDNNACTADACDPATGNITNTPINTDDNNACTMDGCDPSTGVYHNPIDPNDNNACTNDYCDPLTGVHNDLNPLIDDNNACTIDACDPVSGSITHTNVNIDDNNACTTDACDPATGNITHTAVNIDDNDACTTDACDPATGNVTHTAVVIDDNNACTTDACDPATGNITHTAVNIDDNDGCTTDACDPATGNITHTAVVIDDNNACTIDACDPATGNITHTAVNIDDNDACTTDACDPATGNITHTAVNFDDNNACTTDGCDPVTGVYNNPINIDDGDPCTVDACDPSTGNVTHVGDPIVVTATPGTIACFGGTTCVTVTATGGNGNYTGTGTFCGVMAGTYTYVVSDDAGCMGDQTITIDQPTKLTVSTTLSSCNGTTADATASAADGTPGYSYLWSNGTVGPNANGLTNGTYTVTATDQNGCTATATVTVNCGPVCPPAPGAISGVTIVCKGNCVVYSVAPVASATSYQWTLPTGATGSSTTNTITVCFTSKFKGGFICVKGVNSQCSGPATCLNLIKGKDKPKTPTAILGPNYICAGQTGIFQIAAVQFATSYQWTVDHGMIIQSGQGSTQITVLAPAGFTGGTVKVKAVNCKGSSGSKSKSVKNGIPGSPGSISGSSSTCKSQTKAYSVGSASNATGYTWSVTGGATIASGQGTQNVTINFNTATQSTAVVSVVANGPCGNSAPKTKSVSVSLNCRTTADGTPISSDVTPVSSLNAYPNPTSGKATVSFNSSVDTKCMMRVMDILGNVLVSESIAAVEGLNTKDLNLDNVAKGVYFISIQTEEGDTQTLRIVVE